MDNDQRIQIIENVNKYPNAEAENTSEENFWNVYLKYSSIFEDTLKILSRYIVGIERFV